jgi:hypothetical protein
LSITHQNISVNASAIKKPNLPLLAIPARRLHFPPSSVSLCHDQGFFYNPQKKKVLPGSCFSHEEAKTEVFVSIKYLWAKFPAFPSCLDKETQSNK